MFLQKKTILKTMLKDYVIITIFVMGVVWRCIGHQWLEKFSCPTISPLMHANLDCYSSILLLSVLDWGKLLFQQLKLVKSWHA